MSMSRLQHPCINFYSDPKASFPLHVQVILMSSRGQDDQVFLREHGEHEPVYARVPFPTSLGNGHFPLRLVRWSGNTARPQGAAVRSYSETVGTLVVEHGRVSFQPSLSNLTFTVEEQNHGEKYLFLKIVSRFFKANVITRGATKNLWKKGLRPSRGVGLMFVFELVDEHGFVLAAGQEFHGGYLHTLPDICKMAARQDSFPNHLTQDDLRYELERCESLESVQSQPFDATNHSGFYNSSNDLFDLQSILSDMDHTTANQLFTSLDDSCIKSGSQFTDANDSPAKRRRVVSDPPAFNRSYLTAPPVFADFPDTRLASAAGTSQQQDFNLQLIDSRSPELLVPDLQIDFDFLDGLEAGSLFPKFGQCQ